MSKVLEVYGFDDIAAGLKVVCKCGAAFTTGFLVHGSVLPCPYCGRKYRFVVSVRLEEAKAK